MATTLTGEQLRDLDAFALLGHGFAAQSEWLLVDRLEPCAPDEADLLVAKYEHRNGECLAYKGRTREVELVLGPAEPLRPALARGNHASHVAAIREAIAAGDVYQVNLTVRATLPAAPGDALLSALCRRGVPKFASWVRLPGGGEFVSASPELFVSGGGGSLVSQPMKGTAPPATREAFQRSEKDIAELAMITDLVRNDMASVCREGSVVVDSERVILELPYALQAVSIVRGQLLPGTSFGDILRALHPGGSITGAPKPAAMRLIEALEPGPRGFYCGTLIHRGARGFMGSLLIRTAERTGDGWVYGVGGGIVWDSDAEAEWKEIELKLGALR